MRSTINKMSCFWTWLLTGQRQPPGTNMVCPGAKAASSRENAYGLEITFELIQKDTKSQKP
jgi:hypothetical protein